MIGIVVMREDASSFDSQLACTIGFVHQWLAKRNFSIVISLIQRTSNPANTQTHTLFEFVWFVSMAFMGRQTVITSCEGEIALRWYMLL